MKQQIRLTESELNSIIEESVKRIIAENGEEEIFGINTALKNAFGGDARRAKSAAGSLRNAGQRVGSAMRQGYNNAKQGIQSRANAFGASMNATKNVRYAQNAVKALQQLQNLTSYNNDPMFGPNSKTGQAIAQTIKLINGSLTGRINADRSSWSNK